MDFGFDFDFGSDFDSDFHSDSDSVTLPAPSWVSLSYLLQVPKYPAL
jgi:hypothetical protein